MSIEQQVSLNGRAGLPVSFDDGAVDDPRALRRVTGLFATGITVVTVGGSVPHGMTANAFTSVSLDPPLVLVCVKCDAQLNESVMSAGSFAVSVLEARQAALARHFADDDRPLGAAQFEVADWDPGPRTGAPLIRAALAHLECELWRIYDGGDHQIMIGRVLEAGCAPGDALLFFSGAYRRLALET